MTASTGTFSFWRLGRPAVELFLGGIAAEAGFDMSATISGSGGAAGALTAGGNNLEGVISGTGTVGDLLTVGGNLLSATVDGRGEIVADMTLGLIVGRSRTLMMRNGIIAGFTAPKNGHTGTFSHWREGRPVYFRVEAAPINPTGTRRRRRAFGFSPVARMSLL